MSEDVIRFDDRTETFFTRKFPVKDGVNGTPRVGRPEGQAIDGEFTVLKDPLQIPKETP
jgi:hypothetical protein